MTQIILTSPFKAQSTFSIDSEVLSENAPSMDAGVFLVVKENCAGSFHTARWSFKFTKAQPDADFVFEANLADGTKVFGVIDQAL
jgi:hypothetical protein